jgi:hypothetical protein
MTADKPNVRDQMCTSACQWLNEGEVTAYGRPVLTKVKIHQRVFAILPVINNDPNETC